MYPQHSERYRGGISYSISKTWNGGSVREPKGSLIRFPRCVSIFVFVHWYERVSLNLPVDPTRVVPIGLVPLHDTSMPGD